MRAFPVMTVRGTNPDVRSKNPDCPVIAVPVVLFVTTNVVASGADEIVNSRRLKAVVVVRPVIVYVVDGRLAVCTCGVAVV
jgi:hypothetical protein